MEISKNIVSKIKIVKNIVGKIETEMAIKHENSILGHIMCLFLILATGY